MDNLNINANRQLKKWFGWLILFLRWLVGGFVGYISSFFLFAISSGGILPLLGFIFVGQYELFDRLVFFVYHFLYNSFISYDLRLNVSLFIYAILWGVISALLASGRKKQIKTGVILLAAYIVVGVVSGVIFSIMMLPT